MIISFFEISPREIERYTNDLNKHELRFFYNSIQEEAYESYCDSEILSVFINSKITADLINAMPGIKFIATRSTGFEHINAECCKQKSISVSNVPLYGENTVAEHTFALLLSLSRNIHKTYVRTLSNNFSTEGIQGFDLRGKTIGVVGAGNIGMHVIRMAKGFGMKAQAFDINKNHFISEILDFNYVSMEELLQTSDIISLHAPYNKNTHHLINKNNISKIKKGAILINTARGGLVEVDALIEALDNNILSGAGLDVIEGEEYLMEEGYIYTGEKGIEAAKLLKQNYLLLHRENVVITPHNAFNSVEAAERIVKTTIKNINAFINGNPINLIH